jgi:hypothetical protein
MADTVLKIVQTVAKRAGIPVPSILTSSSDTQVIQLQALLDEVGQDLITRFRWQELTRRAPFTSIAAESQGTISTLLGVEPEALVSMTVWDTTLQQPLYGPLSDSEYQLQKALVPAGPAYQYRIQNNELLILPTIPAGHTLSVIYRVKSWLINGSTLKQAITADDDVPLLDDVMITQGLMARWKEEKGLPYAENARRFESMAISKAIKSGTKPTLYLDGPREEVVPGIIVPAGNWPL